MSARDIRTSTAYTECDVCGRTLLRGERAETYLHGGERRSVCELCKSRALHEGWILEGTEPTYADGGARADRRRSLLGRLRARREPAPGHDGAQRGGVRLEPFESTGRHEPTAAPARRVMAPEPEPPREPRHVRAIPTSAEQRVASALEVFNASEHPRTVAGVARSLGYPTVSLAPSAEHASLVCLAVSWELCWYRYEIDLSDEVPAVRPTGQGYELSELSPEELERNAGADEHGRVSLI